LEFHHPTAPSLKSLVELGSFGHFPLFETDWIEEATDMKKSLTGNEKVKAKKLFVRLGQHKSLGRKKTLLCSLSSDERRLFIRAFLKMVENKVLDQDPHLH
jgi:hypothetical protein